MAGIWEHAQAGRDNTLQSQLSFSFPLPRSIKLFVFDMDGVIFQGANFWLDVHRSYGTAPEALDLARRYLKSDYKKLSELTVSKIWKNKDPSIYFDHIKKRRYMEGARSTIRFLKSMNIKTAIISSGPAHLADRAVQEAGIDISYANRVEVKNGIFTGKVDVQVTDTNKGIVLERLMRQLSLSGDQVSVIGDSEADSAMAQRARLSFAYRSHCTNLANVSKFRVSNFREVKRILSSSIS